ncbi:MAG: carboxypeptidase-like regulatory domain-containing protein [Pedobacter sp.]|nr:MAG: carboxypeptidase-like regulatory domain-containing protein [Pedobacter sp.]
MLKLSIISLLMFFGLSGFAQTTYSISGHVKNAKGDNIEAATVFLNGSKQATKTDASGFFIFKNTPPGTFQLVINMLGYSSIKQNVVLTDKAAMLNLVLQERSNKLAEVVIGNGSQRAEHLKTFIINFLGTTPNGKNCTILNTEVLEFSTMKTLLDATTEDFLIIENKNLGYKIRYLLRNFRFNKGTQITSYDGECIFENMKGTEKQEAQWKQNRLEAYQGSFMHYLRSLYSNTSRKEGFLAYDIKNNIQPLKMDPNPVDMERHIYEVDSNFIELKFNKRFYVIYDVKKSAGVQKPSKEEEVTQALGKGSIMALFLPNAIIDKKGSYVDYKSFFIQGFWGRNRIGDQLPFEYQPGD